jgi:hypothetical protein
MTGRRAQPRTVVAANSILHRKQLMADHYHHILNAPAPLETLPAPPNLCLPPTLDYNCSEISLAEVVQALRSTRSDGSPGPDKIPARVLKLKEVIPEL